MPNVRIHVRTKLLEGKSTVLESKQMHYLRNVMRLKDEQELCAFNETDGEWSCRIESGSIVPFMRIREPWLPDTDMWLLFSPLKKNNTNFVVEKATELGVKEFLPVLTEYTMTKRINEERLLANAIEAVEQCERFLIPKIWPLERLEKILADFPEDRVLFFMDERGEVKSPMSAFSECESKKISFLVGPEGGFSEKERMLLRHYRFVVPVNMKGAILRAETAAVSILSIWQAIRGEWVV